MFVRYSYASGKWEVYDIHGDILGAYSSKYVAGVAFHFWLLYYNAFFWR